MANKIAIAGQSHVDALKGARLARPEAEQGRITVLRVTRRKGTGLIGDTTLDAAKDVIAALDENDLLALAFGGNQHQSFGLVQHPQGFDFYEPGAMSAVRPGNMVPPYRAVWDVFDDLLHGRDY